MKLITEAIEDVRFLIEGKDAAKKYVIEGVFLQANVKNRNGRIYPKETMQREVARYNVNYINQNRSFGECGHPDSPTVNLDRVSHIVTELKEDGNNWFGKAKIMDTPYGKIVKNFIDEGAKLGVSSRGVGSLSDGRGGLMVGDDYILAAIDIVADPSAPSAFVRGIMEGKEWIMESTGQWTEMDYEKAKKALQTAHKADREAVMLREWNNFMNKLTRR